MVIIGEQEHHTQNNRQDLAGFFYVNILEHPGKEKGCFSINVGIIGHLFY